MRIVYQRVHRASVTVDGAPTGRIDRGAALLLAVEKGDDEAVLAWGARKVAELRAFEDDKRKMNRSLLDVGGAALVVPNFTVAGDVRKGRRPSFDKAEQPNVAEGKFEYFCDQLRATGVAVSVGVFGAMMEVELVNAGPVTFVIERRNDV